MKPKCRVLNCPDFRSCPWESFNLIFCFRLGFLQVCKCVCFNNAAAGQIKKSKYRWRFISLILQQDKPADCLLNVRHPVLIKQKV